MRYEKFVIFKCNRKKCNNIIPSLFNHKIQIFEYQFIRLIYHVRTISLLSEISLPLYAHINRQNRNSNL